MCFGKPFSSAEESGGLVGKAHPGPFDQASF